MKITSINSNLHALPKWQSTVSVTGKTVDLIIWACVLQKSVRRLRTRSVGLVQRFFSRLTAQWHAASVFSAWESDVVNMKLRIARREVS